MAWVWHDPPEDVDRFYANYDHKLSTLRSYMLLGPKPIPEGSGKAVLNATRYSVARVRKYGCLPAASQERVVHERLRVALTDLIAEGEVQFYPITVRARGHKLSEFFAVVPLNEVNCTDVERSQITDWLIPGKAVSRYKSLAHFPGCLGNLNIARDSLTGHVVISDYLKTALEAMNEPGFSFSKPEQMKSFFQ